MRAVRRNLTYANVVSTLCLFLLLGGGAAVAAEKLRKNSVGSKQLRKGAVTSAKIRGGAVTGEKIDLSTLGAVPQAVNAQTLGGLNATQLGDASKLRCPVGTDPAAGACLEVTPRAAAEIAAAVLRCAKDDRRLPMPAELIAYDIRHFSQEPPFEWVELHYVDDAAVRGMALSASAPESVKTTWEGSGSHPYRCATAPLN